MHQNEKCQSDETQLATRASALNPGQATKLAQQSSSMRPYKKVEWKLVVTSCGASWGLYIIYASYIIAPSILHHRTFP